VIGQYWRQYEWRFNQITAPKGYQKSNLSFLWNVNWLSCRCSFLHTSTKSASSMYETINSFIFWLECTPAPHFLSLISFKTQLKFPAIILCFYDISYSSNKIWIIIIRSINYLKSHYDICGWLLSKCILLPMTIICITLPFTILLFFIIMSAMGLL